VDQADMRGEAILCVRGKTGMDDAEGYHDRGNLRRMRSQA